MEALMDPLNPTTAVSAAMLGGLEKHSEGSAPALRRKRSAPRKRPDEENETEPAPDAPKHTLDDLA
jgi:hypothetical protein